MRTKKGASPGNKFAWGNEGGRPTAYKSSYAKMAYNLCMLGFTDKELAEVFEVDERTINNWKKDNPIFYQSIKKGKELADAQVAVKLFERAIGYSHPDTDIKVIKDQIVTTQITKHYPPDTTAATFWLRNRQPGKWRDKVELTLDFDKLSDEEIDSLISAIIEKKHP